MLTPRKRRPRLAAALALIATLLLLAASAEAQTTTYLTAEQIKRNAAAEAERRRGRFDGALVFNASLSMASNRDVVGQVDGFSTLLGIGAVGGFDYLKGRYEMRNTIKLNQAFARTPVVPEFLKTNDVLELENLHNYFLLDWAGVFGRLELATNLFDTEDVRTDPNDYRVTNPEAGQEALVAEDVERFKLNDPLSPLTLKESIGVFIEPIDRDKIKLSVRLGVGGRQTFADNVLVLDDVADTEGIIELKQLDDVFQGGVEAFLGAAGRSEDERVAYTLGASVMVPVLNNDDQDRSATQLTRLAGEGSLTFGVFEWLNLVYSARLINDPQLIDTWQVQNNLLITLQYTLLERRSAAPTDPDEITQAKAAAAEAEARALAAEARAAEAEARALAAERKLEEGAPPEPPALEAPEPPPEIDP